MGWITFNRPQARNALTFAMYEGVAEICARVATTREVKAIVTESAEFAQQSPEPDPKELWTDILVDA